MRDSASPREMPAPAPKPVPPSPSRTSRSAASSIGAFARGLVPVVSVFALLVALAPADASPTTVGVSFVETGLPATTSWSVTFNGVVHHSQSDTIHFAVGPGTYTFLVKHHPSYRTMPKTGSVTVGGLSVLVPIQFVALGTDSSIVSNFNGNSIPGGDWIWFNSVVKPASPVPAAGLILRSVGQSITLGLPNGTDLVLSVPDAKIVYSPTATSGSTVYANRWLTTVPGSFTDNVFLSGLAFHVPSGGLPGGIKAVNWSGTFSVNSAVNVSFHWQWAAAVYTNFTGIYNALDVKPLHSSSLDAYPNGNQAGTPEAFTAFVTGGARGGGGSNFTGSYSGTASVSPKFVKN